MLTVEEALIIIQKHVVSVQKDGNRTLKVKCDSAKVANELIRTYGVIFGHANVDDAGFHFLNTDKYAYPRFDSTDMRDEALELTQTLIDGGTVTVESGAVTAGPQGVAVDNPTQVTVEETENPLKKTDWTTYIIIGAAAVIILLMLFDRKKK